MALQFGRVLQLSGPGGDLALATQLQRLIDEIDDDGPSTHSTDDHVNGHSFDVVMHAYKGRVICEFDHRSADEGEVARFAIWPIARWTR